MRSDRIVVCFAGVEIKPGKPYTLTHSDCGGRLRLTQVRFFSQFDTSTVVAYICDVV